MPVSRFAAPGLALVIVTLGALAARSRQTTEQTPTFASRVDVVQVDVSVLDKHRKPIRGLTAADFTVLEDGKPRPIVAFTPVELPNRTVTASSGMPAAWTREIAPDVVTNSVPAEGRLVVIVFDWSIRFQDLPTARRIATAAVQALGPGDLGAVVFTSGFANAGSPQNFTADRARLLDAINRPILPAMTSDCAGASSDPRNFNCVMIVDPEGYQSGDCHCRACVMDTITRVADAVRPVEGRRKVVLFISSYFFGIDFSAPVKGGLPFFGGSSPKAARVAPAPAGVGTCAADLTEARERVTRAARLANLTVHVVDPVGLETDGNSPMGGYQMDGTNTGSGLQRRQQMLPMLADLTRGRAVMSTNTPEDAVPAILDETQSFYLLGFESTDHARTGREHRIEVKVARRDVVVQSRTGYVSGETAATSRAEAKKLPLMRAIDGPLPRADIDLAVSAAAFAGPGNKGTVTLVLQADQDDVSAPGGTSNDNEVKVVAAAVDSRAHMIASRESTAIVTRGGRSSGGRYEVLTSLDLEPGRYEIRLAADLISGKRGSVYTYVDVPKFAKEALSVSGLVLSASPAVLAAPIDVFQDLLPLVPTAKREFTATDRATAMIRVYQGGETMRAIEVRARIIDTTDKVVLDERRALAAEAFSAAHAADYQLDLPLAGLAPGDYVLALVVASGEHEVRRNLRFHKQ
jgi:VWFA-related protein